MVGGVQIAALFGAVAKTGLRVLGFFFDGREKR
jgi:hypothetical protein